jgi:serine/threonine-protein kinase
VTPARFGRYEVRTLLGEGGYGQVYRARDPVLARDVAVKVPRGDWCPDEDVLAEARALARLSHPGIVRVLDAGRQGRTAYVVLELVPGRDLETLCEATVPWPVGAALRLLRGPAEAVDHAHAEGILHRDLKPANLIVVGADAVRLRGSGAPDALSRLPVKVADFGLHALLSRRGGAVATDPAGGDPRHAAPEAWRGAPDTSSDVFALASIAFRLVTGVAPVPGASPAEWLENASRAERLRARDVRPDVPAGVDGVLARALSGRRDDRPGTAGELLAELEHALDRQARARAVVGDARRRIAAREVPSRRQCPECRRPLSPRASSCPFCVPQA